jgi:NADH-quinone oxidoreductase subunit J
MGLLVVSALGVVAARQPIHAALWMVSNFGLTAVLYLMLEAPFIAAAQLIVYAGAIMVLFTFVVMLFGRQSASLDEPLGGQRPLALAALAVLAIVLARAGLSVPRSTAEPAEGFGSAEAIGAVLFRDWILPFELMGVLLLAAVVGVVVVARFRPERAEGEGPEGAS